MPNVILEAMAAGIPVISTRVGDVPNIIHDGKNGLLVEPGDTKAFVDAIEKLLNQPSLRTKFSKEGIRTVYQFHLPEIALLPVKRLYS